MTLDHSFRGVGKDARYTLSEGVKEELLRRLLLLNFEFAAREERETEAKAMKTEKNVRKKSVARANKEHTTSQRKQVQNEDQMELL